MGDHWGGILCGVSSVNWMLDLLGVITLGRCSLNISDIRSALHIILLNLRSYIGGLDIGGLHIGKRSGIGVL